MSSYIKCIYVVLKVICISILWLGVPDLISEISLKLKLPDDTSDEAVVPILIFLVGDALVLSALFRDRMGRWTAVSKVLLIGRAVSWFLLILTYEISISEWMVYWHPESYVLGIGVLQFVIIDVIALFIVSASSQPNDDKTL